MNVAFDAIVPGAMELLYLVFIVGFFVFSGVALFHLSEYGYVGDFSRSMTRLYIAIAALIMLLTVVAMIVLPS